MLRRCAAALFLAAIACHALSVGPGVPTSRRAALQRAGAAAAAPLLSLVAPLPAAAAGDGKQKSGTTFVSGKNPNGPPKDPSDRTGTRKDTSYLRCLSNCKADCEKPTGSSILVSRAECLQGCQDECCSTYEQCSYAMREV